MANKTIWDDPRNWLSDLAITPDRLNDSIGQSDAAIYGNIGHVANAIALGDPGGRLTLESGVPVSVTDQTAKATIYYTPYLSGIIGLYDVSADVWVPYQFDEISVAAPGTVSRVFDLFVYNNAGVITLESIIWANNTTRDTALALQNGIYVKSTDHSWRYVGSGTTTSAGSECTDSVIRRFLWNYYNRVKKVLQCEDTTAINWAYTSTTIRAANNNSTLGVGRVDFVIGIQEVLVEARNWVMVLNTAVVTLYPGIGLDSVSANVSQHQGGRGGTGGNAHGEATYSGYPAIGYHFLQRTEASDAAGVTTWYGQIPAGPTATPGMKVFFGG